METTVQVRQHNAITNARYEYSELQLDIFLYLLSKLRKNQPDGVYEVSVIEMSKLTGKKYDYQKLRSATEGMGSRMFEIPNETDKKGRQVWRQMWMFDRVDYVHGTGVIEVEFTRTIQPYLFDLKATFTSFQLYSALRLGSKHAKRIYTLCSQWKDKGRTPEYIIEDLKRMIGLVNEKGDEEYSPFSMFRKRVLDESVKQINQYTDLQIGYTLEKKGRSFKNITFTIKTQPLAVVLPVENEAIRVGAAPVGVIDQHYRNARLLLEKWNIKRADVVNQIMNSAELIQEVNKFAYELQTGKVKVEKNVAGYLLTRLGLKQPKGVKND
ncbi:replication initiation protein [Spirosoma linguale]|uniref:Initiator RepB protein n=1 Tax=Spirosoma linguale (strain ATCC 33905 / DSM 74 / LMG 10896 / Claus 1) TaxID=504472 RepID=D2QVX6_SPILD|nr:initiator RepB protein [Spirosoma linguale DSM 74]